MQTQARQATTMGGNGACLIQGIEKLQQFHCLIPGTLRWRIQPGQVGGLPHTPQGQFQNQWRQIRLQDLRRTLGWPAAKIPFRIGAVTATRSQATSPAGPLNGRSLGHWQHFQAAQSTVRIKHRLAAQTAVHHSPDALDGQTGFCNIRGQHHPAGMTGGRSQHPVLRHGIHFTMQLQNFRAQPSGFQTGLQPVHFPFTRQKDQDISLLLLQGIFHQSGGNRKHLLSCWPVQVTNIHREQPAIGHYGLSTKELGYGGFFQCGGHDQQTQILPQGSPHIQAQGQGKIGLQGTLMELIENHQTHTGKFGVLLQTPHQQAFGQHFDAGLAADALFHTHLVSHCLSGVLLQQIRHENSRHARRGPARFEHDDLLSLQPGLIQQSQRNPGGLARPWRRTQHGMP